MSKFVLREEDAQLKKEDKNHIPSREEGSQNPGKGESSLDGLTSPLDPN
jgi:hypothetical protein